MNQDFKGVILLEVYHLSPESQSSGYIFNRYLNVISLTLFCYLILILIF